MIFYVVDTSHSILSYASCSIIFPHISALDLPELLNIVHRSSRIRMMFYHVAYHDFSSFSSFLSQFIMFHPVSSCHVSASRAIFHQIIIIFHHFFKLHHVSSCFRQFHHVSKFLLVFHHIVIIFHHVDDVDHFHDFPSCFIKFHDFPSCLIKFHDSPSNLMIFHIS